MLKCGLLGRKLGHSYSPQIHKRLGDYEYLLYEKEEEDLSDFLMNGDWNGLNVTIPYKKEAVRYCSFLSDAAAAAGSVNTLVRTENGIYGDNTDIYGFSCLLDKNHIDPNGKKALILGNGGACVAVKYVLETKGAQTVVISRRGPDNYDNLNRHSDAELIVNTTPVGMFPDNGTSPVDLRTFPCIQAVLDIIYNPAHTALVMQAQERRIPNDTGLYMLAAQALRSSELFTGKRIPVSEIDEIVKELSYEMQNIVLVGMPGSGKSTIAHILGDKTGKPVIETDDEIQKTTGISPGNYIEQYGEEAFRQAESQIIRECGKRSGVIISTGGGAVTVESNYPLLHQNGVIFWIQRDPKELPTSGRPLSLLHGTKALYETRKPMYERFADYRIDNRASAYEASMQILNVFH